MTFGQTMPRKRKQQEMNQSKTQRNAKENNKRKMETSDEAG